VIVTRVCFSIKPVGGGATRVADEPVRVNQSRPFLCTTVQVRYSLFS
jgi:hypothetical protein